MVERKGSIPDYGYGVETTARWPLSLQDLLKRTVLFTEEDERHLRMAGEVLEGQADDVLAVWYHFVGSHPHLVHYFSDRGEEPSADYLGRVRERFKRWIFDTCNKPYDQEWRDYQQEICLRHTAPRRT
jgi:hypothetical protein